MKAIFQPIKPGAVQLSSGLFKQRFELNLNYLMSLKPEHLLQNHYLEAGLWSAHFRATQFGEPGAGDERHWGWESPTSQVRGHFLGHWLSAMASVYASTGDAEVKSRADKVVSELARCQERNGGEWVASIPEKYLEWWAQGKSVWSPQYVVHKTLMGLWDMATLTGSSQALEVLEKAARWFVRWVSQFSRQQMDDMLDGEVGGIQETWADLYGITGKPEYLDLMQRYDRRRLFDGLLEGKDLLTNRHANVTIPEALGAARCFEVTGEERWRKIALAYWDCAVTRRGTFCTGGQTSGEVWTPPFEFAARLGERTQEHCTVYNMVRLAERLLRWTGEARFADYIELNLYNGILAQQNAATGMVCYYLPLAAGSRKLWGTPRYDFWCCHGTLVQAQAMYDRLAAYETQDGIAISQYIPSQIEYRAGNVPVQVTLLLNPQAGSLHNVGLNGPAHRPQSQEVELSIDCAAPVEFTLQVRKPAWVIGAPLLRINGEDVARNESRPGYLSVRRAWSHDRVQLSLPKGLAVSRVPDRPELAAFLDGPVVLAGLVDEERRLSGDPARPETMLVPDNERQWDQWLAGYKTIGQERAFRFIPFHQVTDEVYTVYFPVSV